MKILFYRSDWTANVDRQTNDEYGGVGYYRIVKVAEQLKKAGHEVDIVGAKFAKKEESLTQRYTRIFKEYDVLWTCYTSHGEDASAMFYHRDKFRKKVILDLDDNYLDVVESHKLYDKLKLGKKDRAFIGTILSFADAITVSTEPLRQRMHDHFKTVYGMDKKIVVLPNFNDVNDWNYKPVEKNKNKIVIGYAGSNSHNEDLKMLMPHLGNVMNKHKNVYFESTGSIEINQLQNLGMYKYLNADALTRCDLIPSTTTFKAYTKRLSELPWDIALAPLIDDAFTRCKSSIKYFEYSMYEMPTIASRVYPYYVDLFGRSVITDEVNGLLCKPSEWTSKLERLVLDKELRVKLGKKAKDHVVKNWQYKDSGLAGIIYTMLESL